MSRLGVRFAQMALSRQSHNASLPEGCQEVQGARRGTGA